MDDEKNKSEIINLTVNTVFETLRKNGFEIKEKKTTFQQTEQLLYLMPQLKESINHNKKLIEELKSIMEKFVSSGWDLISEPAQDWLNGKENKEKLIEAIKQADKECGSCGCELDPLYKRALELLEN